MTATRKPLDGLAVTAMFGLCVTWGLQQVAVKVAAPAIAPVLQIGIRSCIAALLVALFMAMRGMPVFARDGTLRAGLVVGVLFALEFLLVGLGLTYTTASHMSIFLYTSPVFTALGLHFWVPGERLSALQWLGVMLAFAGVATAFSAGFLHDTGSLPDMWIGDLMGVMAGCFWGMTTVCVRATILSEVQPSKTVLYQLVCAGMILPVYAWCLGDAVIGEMTPLVWGSLAYQTLAVAFASFLVWFWLLRHYLASRLAVFSFLTPVFGVLFGVWLLDDPLAPAFSIGALLILSGITLVNLPGRRGLPA